MADREQLDEVRRYAGLKPLSDSEFQKIEQEEADRHRERQAIEGRRADRVIAEAEARAGIRQPIAAARSVPFDVASEVRRIEVERPAKADASGFVATVARAFRAAWAAGDTFSREEVKVASLRFFSTEAMMKKLARSDPEKLADEVVANLFDMGAPPPSTKYSSPKPPSSENAVARGPLAFAWSHWGK
jgi:hypothetical protein